MGIQTQPLFFAPLRVFFNIHTHLPLGHAQTIEVESLHLNQAKSPSAAFQSVGLHPWYLNGLHWTEAEQWLHTQAAQANNFAIGEAGLDKKCDTPWEVQMQAFEQCIKVSETQQLPLIIHCVRAFSELIRLKKRLKPTQAWILHGFQKNPAIAQQCLDAGCYLSYGEALLQEKGHTAASLMQTPVTQLFLETDRSNAAIADIYQKTASLLGIEMGSLTAQIEQNWSRINPKRAV